MSRREELDLRAGAAFVEEIPFLAGEWEEISDDERATLEWNDLTDRLDALGRAYAASELTATQERYYEALIASLRRLAPALAATGLRVPPPALT